MVAREPDSIVLSGFLCFSGSWEARLVMKTERFRNMQAALTELDTDEAVRQAEYLYDANVPLLEIIHSAVLPAAEKLSRDFDAGRLYIPQMLLAADAFETVLQVLSDEYQAEKETLAQGRIEVYTVSGDIHDIGKQLVTSVLRAHGFEVLDLGRSVSASEAIAQAKDWRAEVIIGFALMTSTVPEQRELMDLLREKEMRHDFEVLVGGRQVSPAWARHIGADGYARDAAEAVRLTNEMVHGHRRERETHR